MTTEGRWSSPTGDAATFAAAFRAWHGPVTGYFYNRLGDVEAARDLAAETFTHAWAAWAGRDPRASLKTWLFRIARNIAIDRYRHQRTVEAHYTLVALDDYEDEAGRWPLEWAERIDVRLDLARVWPQLSPVHREVLQLIHMEGCTYDEAAVRLGIPKGTARRRMNLARTALKRTPLARKGQR